MSKRNNHQVEFGDFQTPLPLAEQICSKLHDLGITPDYVIEPTCGQGNFLLAASHYFPNAKKYIGLEINSTYLQIAQHQLEPIPAPKTELHHANFFTFEWEQLLNELPGGILVLGNLPWVTNSQLGTLESSNLPTKTNFQNRSGIHAITGASNFDISEWMLVQIVQWLTVYRGTMAILCKTHTARKVLEQFHRRQMSPAMASIYLIDAQLHFGAAVDACLLVCDFVPNAHLSEYRIYSGLNTPLSSTVGYRYGFPIRDVETFDTVKYLFGQSKLVWRSGIKHDCAKIMELSQTAHGLTNGLHEIVQIEATHIYPLLKGSDIANGRVNATNRYMLVPQNSVGQSTTQLQFSAPQTWEYLLSHADYLDKRKSQLYRSNPRFSIFGVGDYSFAPWKIAISALYKSLNFGLVGPVNGKPVVFDDTVYYLSFEQEDDARIVLDILNSKTVQQFYQSQIFWDDKRPIKATILNRLALHRLAHFMTSNDQETSHIQPTLF